MGGKGHADEDLFLDKICNMVRLRHFNFTSYFRLNYSVGEILAKSFLFDNLWTLYHVIISYEDSEKILKLMPKLVELSPIFQS